jgi:hypothetical protein
MTESGGSQKRAGHALPGALSVDLKGRQSVRATFKLSQKAIEALSIIAVQLGIKQKSLFDHLMDDLRSLETIAREVNTQRFDRLTRVQKTYVLSRKTLSSLDAASRNFDAPRDALVEYSIQRLLPLIDQERERHERRKTVLNAMEAYLAQGQALLTDAEKLLGQDDPVYQRLEASVSACKIARDNIRNFVERGKCIENF